jgi:hypothetical protein
MATADGRACYRYPERCWSADTYLLLFFSLAFVGAVVQLYWELGNAPLLTLDRAMKRQARMLNATVLEI